MIITIDGNIGSGKTTVLNYLHNKCYFNMQIRVWLDRAWIQEKDNSSIIFMERSPFFIRNTFNMNDYLNNNINQDEYNVINEMYNKTDNIWKSNYYIYLRSSPEKCLEHILERKRQNEINIKLDYIKNIHNLHEETYIKAVENNMNIIVIDVDDKTIPEIVDEIIKNINK